MHSPKYSIPMLIVQYRGIVCILTMVGLVVTILSLKLNIIWEIWVGRFVKTLTNSMLTSCQSFGLSTNHIIGSFNLIPHWRNLNHFSVVMNVSFTDGSKYEDIAKVRTTLTGILLVSDTGHEKLLPFVAHTALTKSNNPLGYLLLQCHRRYLVVDMYAGLEVHTSNTIQEGQNAVRAFGELILVWSLSNFHF